MGLSISTILTDPATLPLRVFLAEVVVVTLSTMRTIFVSRGRRLLAPILGFFEITIWLYAIQAIMLNLSNAGCFIGFAAGFTLGNFLGIFVEGKLAIGNLVVRVITNKDSTGLVTLLRAAGYGVTRMNGEGVTGPVQIVFTVIKRKELANVVTLIKTFDAGAFYSVDELQEASRSTTTAADPPPLPVLEKWRTKTAGVVGLPLIIRK